MFCDSGVDGEASGAAGLGAARASRGAALSSWEAGLEVVADLALKNPHILLPCAVWKLE